MDALEVQISSMNEDEAGKKRKVGIGMSIYLLASFAITK